MIAKIALLAWVTVNGFPVESFDTCAEAEERAAELRQQMPDLRIRSECDAPHDSNRDGYDGGS